MHYILL
jgi:receptor expression-enhancing protein 5/6